MKRITIFFELLRLSFDTFSNHLDKSDEVMQSMLIRRFIKQLQIRISHPDNLLLQSLLKDYFGLEVENELDNSYQIKYLYWSYDELIAE